MPLDKKKKDALKKAAIVLFIGFGGAAIERYAGLVSQLIDIILGFL